MNRIRLAVITGAAAGILLLSGYFRERYVLLEGRFYPRDALVLSLPEGVGTPERLREFPQLRWLTLPAMEAPEYDRIAAAVPGCRIVWNLKFQGSAIPAGAKTLTLEHLSEEDVSLLDHLPHLKTVDAARCRDYPQLMQLIARRPECRVHYTVDFGDVCCDCRDELLVPGRCSAEEMAHGLSLLPRARLVDLRGTALSHAQAAALADAYPHIRFLWNAELGGVGFPTNAEEIDLSGIPMEDTQAVEELLPYLPEVTRIVMCDCGIPSAEMAALAERHPEIRFVWRVKLGPLSARTDDTWFAPITHHQLIGGHDADELKYCTDMECIDLGHCWIRDCEWARGMKNLRYLVLADSYVRDLSPLSELKNLTYLELFVTPVKDYSPLLGCTGLEDLNLGYTSGDPAPIARMTWLKNLWWGGIRHVPWLDGRDPAAILRSGLPDTHIVLYSGSSTGLGWRNLPHYYEMRDRIGMYYMTG